MAVVFWSGVGARGFFEWAREGAVSASSHAGAPGGCTLSCHEARVAGRERSSAREKEGISQI